MPNLYLDRYAYPEVNIRTEPHPDLGLIVTIPCYAEEKLLDTLNALSVCKRPSVAVEVIVVINQSENSPREITEINQNTFEIAKAWIRAHNGPELSFHLIYKNDLPQKHAGVGLARKIAMDEAVRRLEITGDHLKGVISCLDADCVCDNNYLVALFKHFRNHPDTPGCSIYFEHPLSGDMPEKVYEGIVAYELNLRYYVQALKYCAFPHAFHTVGSSMAVRSSAYQKQGGMNRRKAAEDFYFIHKLMPLGNYTDCTDTTVYPSPRASFRVPVGTGRSILKWLEEDRKFLPAYDPQIFEDLKPLFKHIDLYYSNPDKANGLTGELSRPLLHFLNEQTFIQELNRISGASTGLSTFRNHFFSWFNGFKMLKYVHFARDHYYGNIPVEEAAKWLMENYFRANTEGMDIRGVLQFFREVESK